MFFRKQRNTGRYSDTELLEAYRNSGDKQYIGELFTRYTHLVFGVCMKYLKNPDDSDDAVMEIFESLMDKLLKHQVENFKSWLHSVARNHCLMQLRKKKQVFVHEDQGVQDGVLVEMPEVLHHNSADMESRLQELEAAIEMLSPEQKQCVELFYLQEKCYQEVADITGYSMKQVKSYIQNGKRNLKIKLSG